MDVIFDQGNCELQEGLKIEDICTRLILGLLARYSRSEGLELSEPYAAQFDLIFVDFSPQKALYKE